MIDSTYLLPAFNVEITEGWSKNDLLSLLTNSEIEIYYCDLSLFEIYTKCMNLVLQKKISIDINRIENGLNSILHSKDLLKIDWWNHISESEIILQLKSLHNDSIDCLLYYLSVIFCDSFATFDSTFINKVQKSTEIIKWVKKVNENFSIWFGNLSEDRIKFIQG
ncbi:MAG: hypothetical protein GF317_17410 [Candidatus Lokiarchaeota archaeon]|nr:hypothetical protein [Candidatus Lokiarchaeota archaeon]MBD3201298.1 hypothetical protein [Candidatus Lokiarchaeota archaeon]